MPLRSQEKSLYVLWVENNPKFVVVVRSFLHPHDLTVVPSLAEARQCLNHKTFDIILLDYDLDDGKGTALLPTLSALASRPLVIATSSHSEGNSKLLADGANRVCSKRDFGQIEQMLEQAVEIIAALASPCQSYLSFRAPARVH